MKIGVLGLGKMGIGMALQLREKGYDVIGFNRGPEPRAEFENQGGLAVDTFEELSASLGNKKTIILSVPHQTVDDILFGSLGLAKHLNKGDLIIDGANAFYKDSIKRYKNLEKKGVDYLDMGISGGPAGARHGASIMVGGEKVVFERAEKIFKDLSKENGYGHMGPAGSGHFVKMVHNGIEYGMMQSIAEGFNILKNGPFSLDLQKVIQVYSHGSVVESHLVEWLGQAYESYGDDLKGVSGSVDFTGEGNWTVDTAKELGLETPIIEGSVRFRETSLKKPSYIGQILSGMRNRFGGHSIKVISKLVSKK